MSDRLIARMLAPVARAVGNMMARGTVVLANAATKMQTLQIKLLSGEAKNDIEHIEPYGFTAHPKNGAEHVTLFLGGDRHYHRGERQALSPDRAGRGRGRAI